MSDETNENRINIEDLPQAEEELTAEDAKNVKGGFNQVQLPTGVKAGDGSVKTADGSVKPASNFGDTPGLNGGDMVSKMS